ncbi:beta-mannosidase [Neolewinella aurantiaca]|uniref:Beta-mannosidase n=1 Tax=Neolewinella aurantiaca TaxID=2602767 RepID=A0A5C7FBY5_9BACT|nr:glycosyl hydrolase [Neolewinella aurantiaca]TXF88413.1 beta-mannosidase [Neolewinella aurantiaca]
MPIDHNATPATRALYDFLLRNAKGPTLFGHQDALAYGVNWKDFHEFRTDVHDVSGKHPAVFGWDIGKIGPRPSNLDLVDFRQMRFWMREVYRRGGINTVSWHANNFLGGDAWAVGTPTVAAILPGGSHHQAYRDKLELIAGFLRKVSSGPPDYLPVPIIFRPFHEHTGHWFWWGKPHASSAEYIRLWRFTVRFLRDEQQLHHLLWCYSTDIVDNETEYLEYYPGDDFVDILGLDDYHDVGEKEDTKRLTARLNMLVGLAERKGKVAALTETGYEATPKPDWWTQSLLKSIVADPVASRIAWALVWRNDNKQHHYAPYPEHLSAEDFKVFAANEEVMMLDELPVIYPQDKPV